MMCLLACIKIVLHLDLIFINQHFLYARVVLCQWYNYSFIDVIKYYNINHLSFLNMPTYHVMHVFTT